MIIKIINHILYNSRSYLCFLKIIIWRKAIIRIKNLIVPNDLSKLSTGTLLIKIEFNMRDTIKNDNKKILFWLYFPHCRFVFVNYNVYNPKNDAQWMSFDDLFQKRQFNSTIYKQSNTFDRTIDTYRTGIDALYESQKITEEFRNFEHDLWHF